MSTPRVVSISTGNRDKVRGERDALVIAHLKLVTQIAQHLYKLTPSSFELDDLIGEGRLGLIRAAQRYRPRAHGGCPFSAFARPRIRGAILDSIRRRHFIENTRPSIDVVNIAGEGRLGQASFTDDFLRGDDSPLAVLCADPAPLPDTLIDHHGNLRSLADALSALPDEQRSVLETWYGDGFENGYKRRGWRRRRNIAALHDVALQNLKTEYRRAA